MVFTSKIEVAGISEDNAQCSMKICQKNGLEAKLIKSNCTVKFLGHFCFVCFNSFYTETIPESTTTFVSSDEPDAIFVNTHAASNCMEGLSRNNKTVL